MKKKKWARAYELRAMFRADCVIDDRGSDFYYILYSIFVKEKTTTRKKVVGCGGLKKKRKTSIDRPLCYKRYNLNKGG